MFFTPVTLLPQNTARLAKHHGWKHDFGMFVKCSRFSIRISQVAGSVKGNERESMYGCFRFAMQFVRNAKIFELLFARTTKLQLPCEGRHFRRVPERVS